VGSLLEVGTGFHPELTGWENMVKHYSSGMYVRLAFAVAAHLEPEILLVDEVLAMGDAAFEETSGEDGDGSEGRLCLKNACIAQRWVNRLWLPV